jgi:NADPH-dependent ferric siderophore reductase
MTTTPSFPTTSPTTFPTTPRTVQRVRHALKVRRVQVLRTHTLSDNVRRITLGGPELADFVSASFDDHVKLMLPAPGLDTLVLPVAGPNGPELPPGAPKPVMRDYTPRRFDSQACELDIEFALHGDGPAARWAAQAQAGQEVGIGGPRGSFVIPSDFDWHLLIGDETALPAIARRLEELPAGSQVLAVLAVAEADLRALASAAEVQLHWVAPEAQALLSTLRDLALPAGEGYAWAAGEARSMAAVREVLIHTLGIDRQHCRCAAYWKEGAISHHENLQDAPG